MKRMIITMLCSFFMISAITAQVGYGFTVNHDIYVRYNNPEDGIAHSAAGSALLNLGLGPKLWFGGEEFSLSLEALATISPLGLAVKDYKGLGMASFPFIARFNFKGLSGLNKEGNLGWSIGAGIQYNKTELFALKDSFEELGVTREFQRVYVGLFAYGFGISGFTGHAIVKYGYDPDTEANAFHIGLQYDFNIPKMRKISDPASEL